MEVRDHKCDCTKLSSHKVEIRGHKWDPSVAGHYYCQQGTEEGWKSIELTMDISECGIVTMDVHELGLPKYSGNEVL